MEGFGTTPEYIRQAAIDCHTTADDIWIMLGSLQNYVIYLESIYHGVAATTFQSLMVDYDIFAKMLHAALNDIGQGLQGNYVNYTQTEEQNIANLQPIGNDIPGAHL